ncbi:hypothetical protein BDW69DRAFT_167965 [Aspergillus filifer]
MKRLLSKSRKTSRSSKSSSPRAPNIPADAERQSSSTAALPHETNEPSAPESERQLNAPLENLPPEVRRHIFSMMEFEGLKALIHASPVYYQQYFLDRCYILGNSLETTLGPIFIDAYAVYQSSHHDFLNTRTRSTVLQALDDYNARRSQSDLPRINDTLAENGILEIVDFYRTIVTPFVQRYASWALDNLVDQAKTPRSADLLSATEKLRIVRALYRFQLFCNLFGLGHCQLPRWERPECEFKRGNAEFIHMLDRALGS